MQSVNFMDPSSQPLPVPTMPTQMQGMVPIQIPGQKQQGGGSQFSPDQLMKIADLLKSGAPGTPGASEAKGGGASLAEGIGGLSLGPIGGGIPSGLGGLGMGGAQPGGLAGMMPGGFGGGMPMGGG